MNPKTDYDIIIIGGGIGGCAAALRSAQDGMELLLITGSKASRKRSRSAWVHNIDNMIGLNDGVITDQVRTSLGKAGFTAAAAHLAGEHYHFNNRRIIDNTLQRLENDYADWVTILRGDATGLARTPDGFSVVTDEGTTHSPAVVLATGIMDEQPQFEIIDRSGQAISSLRPIYPFANRGVALYCIRCEGHLTRIDPVAIIGHSETAVQIAFMFYERYRNPVTLLGNGTAAALTGTSLALCEKYGIEIVPDPITRFVSGEVGQLCGVEFAERPEIKVRFALVALGTHRAYNDLARAVDAELASAELPLEQRQVLIDYRGETSVPGLFAVGDLAVRGDEPVMKQIYTAQEYAVRAVDSIDSRRRKVFRETALAS